MRTVLITSLAILLLTMLTPTASAGTIGEPASYTFFPTPTKWEPGADTASIFSASTPPGSPGAASWSLMPTGTPADSFDPHPPSGTVTTLLGMITGPGAGTEIAQITAALNTWAAVCGFTNLGMVADTGLPFNTVEPGPGNTVFGDIRLGGLWFDGPGGTLAHAYQPGTGAIFGATPTIGGDLHMDRAETWVDVIAGGTGGIDFQSVILHELGHSLGLSHSSDVNSVMYAYTSPNTAKRTLQADDIAGIQAIYGPALGVVVPLPGAALPAFGFLALLGGLRLRRRK